MKVKARKSGEFSHEFGECFYTPKSGVHQLRLVVYPIIYRVFYIPELRGGNTVDGSEILLINLWRKSSINSINPSFKNRQLNAFTIRGGICLESFWEEEEMAYSGAEVS